MELSFWKDKMAEKKMPRRSNRGRQCFVIDAGHIVGISKPHFTFSGQRQHWKLSSEPVNLFKSFKVATTGNWMRNWWVRILYKPYCYPVTASIELLIYSCSYHLAFRSRPDAKEILLRRFWRRSILWLLWRKAPSWVLRWLSAPTYW